VISIFGNYVSSILNAKDARVQGGEIVDRKLACQKTSDMLLMDIRDGKITLPTNDTMMAAVDVDSLLTKGMLKIDTATKDLDLDSKDFMSKIKKVVQENLDCSSMPIVEGVYTYKKAATDSILSTTVRTNPGWNK
jgi:hypothetical protein